MLPYTNKFLESTPWLPQTFFPRFVHVAQDHIRIDDKVIQYEGVTKSQLEWIRKQWEDWSVNPCHENNKEWAVAIVTILQDRLAEFFENAKLEAEVLNMEVPDYELSSIIPSSHKSFKWRLGL